MSDPLDAVFVTGDEAAELKRTDTARKLATYLERMPAELRSMFTEEFQHISRAELAQLRADLQAAQDERDEARAWHANLNAMIERKNAIIESQMQAIDSLRRTNAEQARQLNEAKNNLFVMTNFCEYWLSSGRVMNGTNDLYILNTAIEASRSWLASNPAQPQEQSA